MGRYGWFPLNSLEFVGLTCFLGGNHRRVLGLSGNMVGRTQPCTDGLHLSLSTPGADARYGRISRGRLLSI